MKILEALPELSERQRRLLAILGYPAFGIFVFFFAFYAAIPRDRLRERLERELSQDVGPPSRAGTGMDVTIGDLGLSLVPPGARLTDVSLKQRNLPPGPDGAERKPQTYFIESLDLRTSLLDLLVGARSGKLAMAAFGGEVKGAVRLSGVDLSAELKADDVALARVPMLSAAVPLPLSGKVSLNLDIKGAIEPKSQRFVTTSAAGLIEVTVEDGVIGDGKAKLVVPGDPFLSAGLTFPRVRLGKVTGRVVIAKSRATLAELRVKSPDAEAAIEGYIELRDPLPASELHLYLRFKPSADLTKREPSFELVVNGLAAGKRSDGFLGFAITGTVGVPLARPSKDPPSGVSVRSSPLGMATGPSAAAGPPPPAPGASPPPPAPSFAPPPIEPSSLPNYRSLPSSAPPPPAPVIDTPSAPEPAEPPGGGGPGGVVGAPPPNYPTNQKGE